MLFVYVVFSTLFYVGYTHECVDRKSIEKSLLDAHVPGLAIVVVNSTDILYEDAFGHQSFLPTRLMDVEKSIFVLASISKTFIATAVMQLVESNIVQLDRDINAYLLPSDPNIFNPFFPTIKITLRKLLSHSASIASNPPVESYFFRMNDQALTDTTLAEGCFTFLNPNASNWLPHPPGTVTLYSNTGSGLAALVVERVTKMPFDQYVRMKILQPLGIDLKKAAFRLSDIEDHSNLVRHYSFNSSQYYQENNPLPLLNITQAGLPNWLSYPFYSVSIYPAGLLRMSAHSLSIYLRMFMNNGSPLLRPDSIAQMRTIVPGVIPYDSVNKTTNDSSSGAPQFGISWYWQKLSNGRRYIGHGGSMPSVTHSMLVNEKGNIGFILLTSADAAPATDTTTEIGVTLGKLQLELLDCFDNEKK